MPSAMSGVPTASTGQRMAFTRMTRAIASGASTVRRPASNRDAIWCPCPPGAAKWPTRAPVHTGAPRRAVVGEVPPYERLPTGASLATRYPDHGSPCERRPDRAAPGFVVALPSPAVSPSSVSAVSPAALCFVTIEPPHACVAVGLSIAEQIVKGSNIGMPAAMSER